MTSTGQFGLGKNIVQSSHGATSVLNIYQDIRPRAADAATVSHARQRLAQMPGDAVPSPAASLPASSRMPLRPNPLFLGRLAELKTVAQSMAAGRNIVVTGMRGVGKTQLASEFVHRYAPWFAGGVYWLSFAEREVIGSEVAHCGGAGYLDLRPDFAGLPLDDRVRVVLAEWAGEMPRLLVFDNCEDPELFERWAPRQGGCRILCTSWRARWPATLALEALPIEVLQPAESRVLLARYIPSHAESTHVATIAEHLGHLPLALHLAGSVMAQYPDVFPPEDYLDALRTPRFLDGPSLESEDPSPTGHVRSLGTAFALSLARLDPQAPADQLASRLLARAAHFAPGEPIAHDTLFATARLETTRADRLMGDKAVQRLESLGLVDRGTAATLRLHRLVAVFAKDCAANPDDAARGDVEASQLAAAVLRGSEPALGPLLEMQAQLRHVAEQAAPREDEMAYRLLTVLADHWMKLGAFANAQGAYERALGICRPWNRRAETVAALNRLGMACKEQAHLKPAEERFREALRLDPDSPLSLNNLGFVLKDSNEHAEALDCFQRALEMVRVSHGDVHDETLVCLNNVGLLHKDKEDFDAAEKSFRHAYRIACVLHGAKGKGLVPTLTNLAFLEKDRKRFERAHGLFVQALEITRSATDGAAIDTIHALNNVAFVLLDRALALPPEDARRNQWFAQAQAQARNALDLTKNFYPEQHPMMAEALDNLGETLMRHQGQREAELHFERALAIRLALLGEQHLETARSLTNVGRALVLDANAQDADRLTRAVNCLERAVAVYDALPLPDHKHVDRKNACKYLASARAEIDRTNDLMSNAYRANHL